ncbi:hypothetical protein GSI_01433 [Ganoderma sinense ZZ0214-1]|uniref:Uncharacterized protein n=1 Tax=Ganoderma sinense ZZ0214-1 TaxID=1077348 RepID=A0A2G8SVE4_9APHY|nr:hypothetical protein GSI_01433 [Ganoderma sinense ZZ0214-1]
MTQPPSIPSSVVPSLVPQSSVFPTVAEFLDILDTQYPELDYPRFGHTFFAERVERIDQLALLSDRFLMEVIGMPFELCATFVQELQALLGRLQKGKGRASGGEEHVEVYEISSDEEEEEDGKF